MLQDQDREVLQRLLGRRTIPEKIVVEYHRVQRMAHQIRNGPLEMETLILICRLCNEEYKPEAEPAIDWSTVEVNSPVMAIIDDLAVASTFIGFNKEKNLIRVLVEGEDKPRVLDVAAVRSVGNLQPV